MPIGTHFAIHIKIVQQHEFACEGMMVRRYQFREEAETGLTISLWKIAQDLVVCTILFNDVNAMRNGRGVPQLGWNGVIWFSL